MKKLLLKLSVFTLCCLVFSAVTFAQVLQVPPGTYHDTCTGCAMFGNWLHCVCKNNVGFPRGTSVNVTNRCRFVVNDNGSLRCVTRRQQNWRRHHFVRPKQEFNAGPIWNQNDAENKCPSVCHSHYGRWTGQWHTVQWGQNSVCECEMR